MECESWRSDTSCSPTIDCDWIRNATSRPQDAKRRIQGRRSQGPLGVLADAGEVGKSLRPSLVVPSRVGAGPGGIPVFHSEYSLSFQAYSALRCSRRRTLARAYRPCRGRAVELVVVGWPDSRPPKRSNVGVVWVPRSPPTPRDPSPNHREADYPDRLSVASSSVARSWRSAWATVGPRGLPRRASALEIVP